MATMPNGMTTGGGEVQEWPDDGIDIVDQLRLGGPNALEVADAAADEIENMRARMVALKCFAQTLAVHVEGHFALPTKDSESICKRWAATVLSENVN